MATVKTLIPKKETEVKRIRVAAYCRVSTDSADQKRFLRRTGRILHTLYRRESQLDSRRYLR